CCPRCKSKGKAWSAILMAEAREIAVEQASIEQAKEAHKQCQQLLAERKRQNDDSIAADRDQQTRLASKQTKLARLSQLRKANNEVCVTIGNGPALFISLEVAQERVTQYSNALNSPGVPPAPEPAEITNAQAEVERLESLEHQHNT